MAIVTVEGSGWRAGSAPDAEPVHKVASTTSGRGRNVGYVVASELNDRQTKLETCGIVDNRNLSAHQLCQLQGHADDQAGLGLAASIRAVRLVIRKQTVPPLACGASSNSTDEPGAEVRSVDHHRKFST
jgi:hypothetical protein